MSILSNLLNGRAVKNAIQQQDGFNHLSGSSDNIYTRNLNPNELFYGNKNTVGKYDNYYGDSNRIVSVLRCNKLCIFVVEYCL